MKQILERLGWKCSPCSCPGRKGYDCASNQHKGIVIQDRGTSFRIIKNSLVIESAHSYQLEQKMKTHGLL